ncbi:MAG: hypothetical protein JO023_02175, partial [Chloroflexi bacterium]|nr:hypothetical protein [Chloroflexota bacterium]
MKRALAAHLLEAVTPRTNAALLSSAEHLFGALALATDAGPVALEIAADHERRRFLLRATTTGRQRRLAGQLGAAYPQAQLRPLDPIDGDVADPARLGQDEQLAACTLALGAAPYLPLRILRDRDLDADAGPAQADPVLGTLAALGDLPPGWRGLAQLVVLGPAPAGWAEPYQRLALESPIQAERATGGGVSLVGPLLLVGLLLLALAGSSAADAWQRGDWAGTLGPVASLATLGAGGLALRHWLGRSTPYEPRLVADKLSCAACLAELRLAIIAPAFAPPDAALARLERLATAYRPFGLAAGNELVPRPVRRQELDLRDLAPLGGRNSAALLNVRELAALWHLPQAADEVAALERTTARRRLPLAATVAYGCRVGVAAHQGQRVPVHLAPALLRRHLLAVAKTRRGKSSLLLRLVQHHLTQPSSDRHGLILVDPHRDLAMAALSLVPPGREADVVYLDLADQRRPFGLNLLDVGLGWDRDQAVSNALRVFRREFDAFWGPRMEDAFRVALLTLFEANQTLCRDDPHRGRAAQHTVLEVPALLARRGFRQQVLKHTSDAMLRHWFDTYFDPLEPRLRLEIINPVQTKVHKYLASRAARQIVGQPASTIDFRQLIAAGKIVLVNLSLFEVGEDIAALVGGTLLNLAARAVGAQASLPPAERRPVTIAVDEFHTIPGADYEQVFGELAKYGANMILATQTLARLDHLTDAQRTRDLRAVVFSNLDGLFAFHVSAEDAAYLADELGGGLDAQDLLELGHYQCYARLTDTRSGERLPAFSLTLDPPPPSDPARARLLAEASAAHYGRDAVDVDLDLQTALERMHGPHWPGWPAPESETQTETGVATMPPTDQGAAAADQVVTGTSVPAAKKARPARARGKKTQRTKVPAAG